MVDYVTEDDVEEVLTPIMRIYAKRPENVFMEPGQWRDMYDIFATKTRKGCFISVKVPTPSEKSHALHLNVRYMIDPKHDVSVSVYPRRKEGAGHFFSKSIPRRESSWRQSLGKYAKEGMDMCIDRFAYIAGLPKSRINSNTIYFEKYDEGDYHLGRCTTGKAAKDPANDCMSVEGYQADDIGGVKHYITVPRRYVSNYDDIEMGNIYDLPDGSCKSNVKISRIGNPYRNCSIVGKTTLNTL